MFETLGERLQRYRAYRRLTADKFGARAGISATHVGNIERGDGVTLGMLGRIFAAYPDLNPAWLLLDSGPMLMSEVREEPAVYLTGHVSPSDQALFDALDRVVLQLMRFPNVAVSRTDTYHIQQWRAGMEICLADLRQLLVQRVAEPPEVP